MMRDAKFEVVRTDAGWHARFRAWNGKVVWTTEVYTRRGAAVRAVELITGSPMGRTPNNEHPEVDWAGVEHPTEVHFLDERTAKP